MKAYDKGFADGRKGSRKDRYRTYETDRLERDYWRGYLAGMIADNPGKDIVQCEREGAIFAVNLQFSHLTVIACPVCGRRYIKEGEHYESDRRLRILHRVSD